MSWQAERASLVAHCTHRGTPPSSMLYLRQQAYEITALRLGEQLREEGPADSSRLDYLLATVCEDAAVCEAISSALHAPGLARILAELT